MLTADNAPRLPQEGRAGVNPPAGRVLSLLQTRDVRYNGEPIAVGPLWLHEIEYDGEFARPHKWPGATGSASGLALYPFSMSQCNSRRRLGIG